MIKRKHLVENYEAIQAFWDETERRKDLPNTAVLNLPTVLSRNTQARLALISYDEAMAVLKSAIEMVDNGSVKKIDSLVIKEINKIAARI